MAEQESYFRPAIRFFHIHLSYFAIQEAIKARFSSSTSYKRVTDPDPQFSFRSCHVRKSTTSSFLVSILYGAEMEALGSLALLTPLEPTILGDRFLQISLISKKLYSKGVRSFRTANEVDDFLFKNPMTCPGALYFVERNATVISYGVQTNSTTLAKRGTFEDPTFKFQIPLQIAAEREIARSLIGVPNFSWIVTLKEFAHPALEIFSALASVGPSFFLATAMFGFAMSMMGLYDSAYWLSWLTWEGILALISSLVIVLVGMMFQFDFFLNNSFAVVFLVFFLFQLNMLGVAFLLSAFITKASSSTTAGFFIFIVGTVTQAVTAFGFPYSSSISKPLRNIWSLFPPNLLAEALQLLVSATATPQDVGVSWSNRGKCAANDDDCVITINDIYIWLVATFFIWLVLAIYFDNIIPNVSGVRKSVFYFLNPGYWIGKGGNNVKEGGICSCIGSLPPQEHITPDDEDVLEEENLVKQQIMEGVDDPNIAVQVRGLGKTYPGSTNMGCCKCKRNPPYQALKGLWVNFAKDQLFCLLGPNGAGKTTAINCLTGITPVTNGDALIYGIPVRSSIGMSKIRKLIGVCPQVILLSSVSYLIFSGIHFLGKSILISLPVLKATPIFNKSVIQKSLEEVKLTEAANIRAGSYSGGMKRRLSVAIALIGDPKLVILDEPTTGMDPITRRHVWDIIENAKRGRAIVLTTHSMEEADILSDRIGIMAKGKLRCIGTSIRLKSRFGTGFIANVSFSVTTNGQATPNRDVVDTTHHEDVKQFFKHHLNVEPKEENKSFLTFVIPHDREVLLPNFFKELQDRVSEFGIADIQLGTSIEIPVGARFVGIPGTETSENLRGNMVEVYWDQDESGNLCISGHSDETPIPPNVDPVVSLVPAPPRRSILGRQGVARGIVLDPNQVITSNSH
ncbi:hypothetical protein F8388_004979 [Cannabis sativa]|uniref:ABC transporter domain-containing protein n=1 Tax=Cannabis sativa TaxID=3483 RepID=A0A7J6G1J2_CANSA|nr:hypothetical protein F8388_004979 [Cannabis sativa]